MSSSGVSPKTTLSGKRAMMSSNAIVLLMMALLIVFFGLHPIVAYSINLRLFLKMNVYPQIASASLQILRACSYADRAHHFSWPCSMFSRAAWSSRWTCADGVYLA